MINSRQYVAVQGNCAKWYSPYKLMRAVMDIANPVAPEKYGLESREGQMFFEVKVTEGVIGIEAAETIVNSGFRVAISSKDNDPRRIKRRLEAAAEGLILEAA